MSQRGFDPATWAELNRLLNEALDRPAAERVQWLDTLDPSLGTLKTHLRSLLSAAAHLETRDFLETLPKVDLESQDAVFRAGRIDEEIGP
jgi:hypothetical protein